MGEVIQLRECLLCLAGKTDGEFIGVFMLGALTAREPREAKLIQIDMWLEELCPKHRREVEVESERLDAL